MDPANNTTVALVESNSRPMGVQLVNTRQTNKCSDPTDLVELARVVQKGNEFVRANAGSKLVVIAEQIRFLQQQAQRVLEEAKQHADLHHVACNLVKKPGTTYYLYRRESGQKYFSILSPQEWGSSCPHEYLGGYRLEHDMSWTPVEEVERRSQEIAMIDKVLNRQMAITESASQLPEKKVTEVHEHDHGNKS